MTNRKVPKDHIVRPVHLPPPEKKPSYQTKLAALGALQSLFGECDSGIFREACREGGTWEDIDTELDGVEFQGKTLSQVLKIEELFYILTGEKLDETEALKCSIPEDEEYMPREGSDSYLGSDDKWDICDYHLFDCVLEELDCIFGGLPQRQEGTRPVVTNHQIRNLTADFFERLGDSEWYTAKKHFRPVNGIVMRVAKHLGYKIVKE